MTANIITIGDYRLTYSCDLNTMCWNYEYSRPAGKSGLGGSGGISGRDFNMYTIRDYMMGVLTEAITFDNDHDWSREQEAAAKWETHKSSGYQFKVYRRNPRCEDSWIYKIKLKTTPQPYRSNEWMGFSDKGRCGAVSACYAGIRQRLKSGALENTPMPL